MKRFLTVVLLLLTLTGCASNHSAFDRAMTLRNAMLKGQGCAFEAFVTADYGEKIYSFGMNCRSDANGTLTFEVTQPDTISGITGSVSNEGGKLTFDDTALMFEMLAEGQVTPVSAPWLLVKALRSGYLKAAGQQENGLRIQIDDNYEDKAILLEILTDENNMPVCADILWEGRRIVSVEVENFTIL